MENEYEIVFENHRRHLFWPKAFPIDGVYQVTAETFDQQDWHYYQKKFTEVREGDVILDVGTAEGLFILAVIDRCNKVILIEPNDYFINVLNKSFASDLDKVVMYNVAIGDRVGEIYFNSSSLIGRVDTKLENGVKKKLETLDHLLLDEPNITFLKADVEGFELEMLIGEIGRASCRERV